MKKKSYLFITALTLLVLSACGQTADSTENSNSSNNADAETIVVGTGNGYQPFVYLDENNELQGYDVEILKAIDEKLPQYSFEYESQDFKNILTSLSAGKVRLAAHQYEYNDERASKYLYGEVGYTDYTLFIVNDQSTQARYSSLDDLVGKKVFASPGGNVAYLLETYNQDHEDQIDIVYNEASSEVLVKGLQNGTADATLLTKYDTNKLNQQFNAELQISTEPINVSKTYFIYQKGEEELKEAVDKALQELIDEGKLAELSVEILGDDYTK